MNPVPDCGEDSYRGYGRLTGKRAIITGGDSGIGRAVAIAFAREGADVLIPYLSEETDANEVARYVEEAGRTCVLMPGDLSEPAFCRAVIDKCVAELGGIDILVNNAAYQMTHETIEEISDSELGLHLRRQHRGILPPRQSGTAAPGSGGLHHREFVGELRHALPYPGAVCGDQGRDCELLGQPGAAAGPQRYSGQQRRARTDLDPADSVDDAGEKG